MSESDDGWDDQNELATRMNMPRRQMDRGSRLQLWAVLLVSLLVMVLGIAVVADPDRMGVPRPTPTPIASPAATPIAFQGRIDSLGTAGDASVAPDRGVA